jgi:Ca2+-binding EF-hand superfamily protein
LSPDKVVERLLTLDINGDGQLTKDEVPDRMLGLFTRADENHDGTMTREELLDMARREAMNR